MNYEELKIKYQKDGYIVLENFFDIEFINKINEIVNDIISNSKNINKSDYLYDLEDAHLQNGIPQVRRIKNPVEQINELEFVIKNEKLLQLLKCFLGANIRLHHSKINMKNPILGSSVEWHQDWAFYPHTNDDVLAVGVMLDDVNLSNGPLMVIPESHKGPVLSHNNSDGIFCGAIDPEDKDFNLNDAIPLTGKAGSISIHHARLLHGSATNKSSSRRMMLFYELSAADSWPLVGAPSYMKFTSPNDLWKQMKSQLISGEMSTCPRMENIPVRIPLPPPNDYGSIFKTQKTRNSKSAFM